jgi:hypothetical protein
LTHWEQLDHGLQYTPTRKFLTIVPIVLFFMASFYTNYKPKHFILNAISLAFVLVRSLFKCEIEISKVNLQPFPRFAINSII